MSNNNIIKGVFLVALGATSYGMLATFVKLAYKEDFTTAEVLPEVSISFFTFSSLFRFEFMNSQQSIQFCFKTLRPIL